MENLAPAGNPQALEYAVNAGADAVYLGYSAFSARAGAGNFDEAALREAVRFCHVHHVRVHVTVNTLVKDSELPEVYRVLRLLNGIPVDAVLIQDLGVLAMARECFPELPVHASTQMAIHNRTGVRWCASQGMARAVLARECSLKEIALCCGEGIEVEVFGHGAQCVSVSGECLFSSRIGGRSGNRGRCAQPCRMRYSLRGQEGAWLSPRDVCLRNEIPALLEAGVASLKLEGRLKRPEYVSEVAAAYRRGIDSAEQGSFRPADEAEMRDLRQIFHRGGFMRGYAMGCEDAGVIDPERVNHGGVPLGTVTRADRRFAELVPELPLHDGDGLQLRGKDGDRELTYSGPEVLPGQTARIYLRPGLTVRPGDQAVRLTDVRQMERAAARKADPIPADMLLRAMPGEPLRLTVTDGISEVTAEGEPVSAARSRSLTEEDARRCLEKTGDTPFVCRQVRVETENAFVPVSGLNDVRRRALAQLEAARASEFSRKAGEERPLPELRLPRGKAPETAVCRTPEQLKAAAEAGVLPVWYPEDCRPEALERAVPELPADCWLRLPTVCEEETLQGLYRFVLAHRDCLGGVLLGSVGQLGLDWPVLFACSEDIPVMNARAAAFLLDRGARFVTAAWELSGPEMLALKGTGVPVVFPAWGRTRLMLLHHCPARTALGLDRGHRSCDLCDRKDPRSLRGLTLRDRTGSEFPLERLRLPEGCLVRLEDDRITDNRERLSGAARLYLFAEETALQVRTVLEGGGRGDTSGYWSKGVE